MKMGFISLEVQHEVLCMNQNNFILYRFEHYLVYYPTYNSYLHVLTPETSSVRKVVTTHASQQSPHTSEPRDFITTFRKYSHWFLSGARYIQSRTTYPNSMRSKLQQCAFLSFRFPIKILQSFLFSSLTRFIDVPVGINNYISRIEKCNKITVIFSFGIFLMPRSKLRQKPTFQILNSLVQ